MENTHKKKKPWFGFTEDVIFGEIMSDKNFCKHVLQGLVPEIEIRDIHYLQKQRKIADPEHPKQKAVILDILVEDVDGNLYDFEMQRADKKDLGWRMRYYASKMDQRYTLKKGSTYRNLKCCYVIFLCMFDPQGRHRIKSSYHLYEDSDKTDRLNDGLTKIIINAKGIHNDENQVTLNLVKLMNDEPVQDDPYFEEAQAKIKEFNEDPEWSDYIMDYEEKILEREQDAREEGLIKGREEGKEEGFKEGVVYGIHNFITIMRDYGENNQRILQRLKQKYGSDFTDEQLENFLKQN